MENLDSKMLEAALNGNLTTVEELFVKGAKISFINANLLCNTAYNGKIDSVKWLLRLLVYEGISGIH